ncbi:MAG: hypothetical protein JSU68_11935 [Phycisphaerales bacterium]|nr:MAG: hypothetical protein JSU68_11935 [Phycisphaerales bacterium]
MKPIEIQNGSRSFHVTLHTPWHPTPAELETLPFGPQLSGEGLRSAGDSFGTMYELEMDVDKAGEPFGEASLKGQLRSWLLERTRKWVRQLTKQAELLDMEPGSGEAAKAVEDLIGVADFETQLGISEARQTLAHLADVWSQEMHDAAADLSSVRSFCPADRRHFECQEARLRRRAALVGRIEAFLRAHSGATN